MEKEITISLSPDKQVTFRIDENSDTSFVLNMTHMWLDLRFIDGT